ncbi:heavy-metal-associated domain-containing protein [Rhodococcus ruber]|uniref:heavy-metal-associated domain-containing protein n=1 Tax=Rhodococcus TaxID=1827 RepID=UPI0009DB856C|nr:MULTISPECIES: heavy-metal-associated domain-containing protein [Rhodococcus]AUM19243.1 copper chaperone [Rhodococcus ruber]AXY49707.1 copper-binding protein [Rhodococcus ruber]MBD8057056.1 heavy-metal-associated domain-containing protein [Rhodococcus ruber]MCF8784644.1 heavy-metal-associated domain-containing protein [Rhodococcus ruber]MCZ1075647.1 heavy-metal-associated domain-containing protein [Rhodococcus sp. A5(2022)]
MNGTTVKVRGMTCGHCVSTVKAAVGSVPGVTAVEVDLQSGTVTSTGTASPHAVAEAISQAGYDVDSAEQSMPATQALPRTGKSGGCCG